MQGRSWKLIQEHYPLRNNEIAQLEKDINQMVEDARRPLLDEVNVLRSTARWMVMSGWKLWLDDQLDDPDTLNRHVPSGYIGAKSSEQAIGLIKLIGLPNHMDLDHDLALRVDGTEDTAMDLLKEMFKAYPDGPVPSWHVHSENIIGVNNIDSYLDSWRRSLSQPGEKNE